MSCDCDYICGKDAVEEQHYLNCSTRQERSPNGRVTLKNKHLNELSEDYLYHLDLSTASDLPSRFGDVKFVCLGGTDERMREFAEYMGQKLGLEPSENLTASGKRYATYKVGPVLSISHGIGIPSMAVALQEVIKLLYYAHAKDPIIIRIGSSGGLGVPGGSVVISDYSLSGTLKKAYELPVLGKIRSFPSNLDQRLAQELLHLSKDAKDFEIVIGATMGADDFYRGQARLDGPFCDYEEADKMAFLQTLYSKGVRNIEMESLAFAAITREANVRSAIVCVTFLNRLQGDQVTTPNATRAQWEQRPMWVLSNLIMKTLSRK